MEKVMTSENIWQQFNTLPTEAKREVIDFIAFLQSRYERPVVKKAIRSKMKLPDASVGVSSGVLSIVNDASVGELNPNKIKKRAFYRNVERS